MLDKFHSFFFYFSYKPPAKGDAVDSKQEEEVGFNEQHESNNIQG